MTLTALLTAFGLVAVVASVGAWAAFTALSTNLSNSFATGNVTSLTNSVGSALLSLSNAKPGDRATGCIQLSYLGSLPTSVRLYGATTGTGADAYLDLKITRGTHSAAPYSTCTNFVADATTYVPGQSAGVVFADSLLNYYDDYNAGLVDPKLSTPESWTTGEVHSYKFELTVGDNPTAESETVTQTFTWEARASNSYREAVYSDAPVSYWRIGESSGASAFDEMLRNTGTFSAGPTLSQPSALTSDANTAVAFDGVDDKVNMPNAANLQLTSGTLEAWVKAATPGAGFRGIVSKPVAYGIYLYGGNLATYDAGATLLRNSGVSLADGSWHHVAMTFQSGVTNGTLLYSDGVLVMTTTVTVSAQTFGVSIGGGDSGNTQVMNGTLDDVAIYGNLLTPEQIKSHFVAGRL